MLVVKLDDFNEYYLNEAKKIIDRLDRKKIDDAINMLLDAYKKEKQIFIIGNGGSATTATHFANDLTKSCSIEDKKRFRAISLTDNISTITALANDTSYDKIFSEQLLNLINKDDILIALTASGNSPNVIEAVKVAKQHGAKTLAFLGFNGGKLKNMADGYILIEYGDFGLVESTHLLLEHLLVTFMRKRLLGEI